MIRTRNALVFDVRGGSETYGSALVIDCGDWVLLCNLHVHPDHRRNGHATALLTHIVRQYAHTTIQIEPKPYLDEPVPTDTLRAWYRRFGFQDGEDGTMFRHPGEFHGRPDVRRKSGRPSGRPPEKCEIAVEI